MNFFVKSVTIPGLHKKIAFLSREFIFYRIEIYILFFFAASFNSFHSFFENSTTASGLCEFLKEILFFSFLISGQHAPTHKLTKSACIILFVFIRFIFII